MSQPSNITNIDPTIPVGQGIYEESTTKKTKLGYKIIVGETKYAYTKAGTNLVPGGICVVNNNTELNKATIGAAVVVGTYEVPVYTVSNWTANQYADAYLGIMDSGGEGMVYRIKSHPAITATTAGQKVTLYDAVAVAMTTAGKVTMTPNPYDNVLSGTDVTATSPVMGIAPVAVTSGNYFWMAISGPAAVHLGNGTATFGQKLCPGTTSYALTIDATANATSYVGICLSLTGTAYDSVLTHLTCERGL